MASKKPTNPSPSDDRKEDRAGSGSGRPVPMASTYHALRLRYSRATARSVDGPDTARRYQHAVVGEEGRGGSPHGRHGAGGGVGRVDRAVVFIDDDGLAPTEG